MRPVVIVAHGSPRAAWFAPFEALARELAEVRDVRVAFLAHRAPTLEDALAELRAEGHSRAIVWPLFLASGGHVTDDIAPVVEAARANGMTLELLAPLLDDEKVRAALKATLPI